MATKLTPLGLLSGRVARTPEATVVVEVATGEVGLFEGEIFPDASPVGATLLGEGFTATICGGLIGVCRPSCDGSATPSST